MRTYIFCLILCFACSFCAQKDEEIQWLSLEQELQEQFILARDSSIINIPEGHFVFTKSLVMDGKKSIIIRGVGESRSILSFAYQEEGAEGLKISNVQNFVLEDLTIEDAKGDNIKVTDSQGITFRHVVSRWNGKPKESNGAYAFYPVLCSRVLIEDCTAIGASDAGIYVGQSDSVIIRNNTVYHNVAGIESENSRWVEIYGNHAYRNTGGILIFDLPGLTQYGHTTRVYQNIVEKNNFKNFAPKGNIVATVPPGTGFLLLATRNIELFENKIIDNRTIGVGIVSYELIKALGAENGSQLNQNFATSEQDSLYNPFPNNVYLHDNIFSNKKWFPTLENDFGLLFLTKFPFSTPDIAIDGIFDATGCTMCISEKAKFVNLDAANDFKNIEENWENKSCEKLEIKPLFSSF